MTPIERDDVVHALTQTLAFYNKELDKVQRGFWLQALNGKSVANIKRALMEYPVSGRYAPKPVDILDIIDKNKEREKAHRPPEPMRKQSDCDPRIAKAWMWFIGVCTQGSENFDGLFSQSQDISPEQADEYLQIVNFEAKQANTPDAIPDEYKLKEVWQ